MKADDRNFEANYKDLIGISDIGADIYGSQLGQDILRESCLDSAVAISVSILKMQLEQEWFLRRKGDRGIGCALGTPEFAYMLHQTVCECVGRRLERYHGPARRGALLALIDSLEELGQNEKGFWTERERAVAARLPEGQLISLAAYEAERHAGGLWAACAQEDGEEAKEAGEPILRAGCHATAAALALAAYAEYSHLRCAPELLADVSAAAAEIAYGEPQEAFAATGYMALLTAAASLVDLAESSCQAAGGAEDEMRAELPWKRAAAFFRPFVDLFSAGLRLAMGAGAAGLLAGAAAAVKDFVPEGHRSLAVEEGCPWQTESTAGEAEATPEEEASETEGEFI